MTKVWRLLSILIIPLMCLGLLLVPGAPPQVAAAGNSGLEVQPAVTTVNFTENFSVNIWANVPANQSWDTADTHLNFSPTYMNVTGITDGGSLTTILGSTFDNVAGTIDYTAGVLGTTVNGSLLVCTINFTSKSTSGVSTLDFVFISPLRETEIIYSGDRLLDWSMVVNGTVKVGGPPTISVSPDNLTFNAIEEGENPPDQTLEVCSSGTGTLDWSLTDTAAWLSETPASGSLGADACEDVTVSVDATGMEAGDYSATITITGSDEVEVAVNLHIESTAPVEPANLSVSSVSISPQQVEPGEEVTISFNVANTGGETGSYNAVLYINGAVEDSQSVSVAPGMTKNVIFTVSKSQAGVYDVLIAGQSGQFEVVSTGWFGGGLGTSGIVAIVVIVIALIVALVFVLRRTRRAI